MERSTKVSLRLLLMDFGCSHLSVAVQEDGKLIVVGSFDFVGGQRRDGLARLEPDGELDVEFPALFPMPPGANVFREAMRVAIQPDQKTLVYQGDITDDQIWPRRWPPACFDCTYSCPESLKMLRSAPEEFQSKDPKDRLGFCGWPDTLLGMKFTPLLVVTVLLVLVGCSKKESTDKDATPSAGGNPLTAPVDYMGAVAKAKKSAEKIIDATSVNHAIQLFYAQEDRFPKDLNELVAKRYISAVPPAPAGMQWSYNPQTGELKTVKQP